MKNQSYLKILEVINRIEEVTLEMEKADIKYKNIYIELLDRQLDKALKLSNNLLILAQ